MTGDLREVRLLGVPLALMARSTEHHEELMREFQLLALEPPRTTGDHPVPHRLIDLVGEVTLAYAGLADAADAERAAAHARGDAAVDLVFRVPADVSGACARLSRMLEEADEFCRAGEQLLTLATPPDAAALRHWYLGEFVAQVGGERPTPWPEYAAAHAVA
ncbi:MAG TPA: hypothetical protein VFQ85_01000 [Mycobacteriales bacterium]|nr:hypothetical protein [Mycobacteriales bacterium]